LGQPSIKARIQEELKTEDVETAKAQLKENFA